MSNGSGIFHSVISRESCYHEASQVLIRPQYKLQSTRTWWKHWQWLKSGPDNHSLYTVWSSLSIRIRLQAIQNVPLRVKMSSLIVIVLRLHLIFYLKKFGIFCSRKTYILDTHDEISSQRINRQPMIYHIFIGFFHNGCFLKTSPNACVRKTCYSSHGQCPIGKPL